MSTVHFQRNAQVIKGYMWKRHEDDDDNEGQDPTPPSARPFELDLELDGHRPQPTE